LQWPEVDDGDAFIIEDLAFHYGSVDLTLHLLGKLFAQPVDSDQTAGQLVGLALVAVADPSLQFVQPLEFSLPHGIPLGTLTLRQRPQETLSSIVCALKAERPSYPRIGAVLLTQRQRLLVGIAPRLPAREGILSLSSFTIGAPFRWAFWTPRHNAPW
jgi:hypothetical protein